jgi:hypothetical protein
MDDSVTVVTITRRRPHLLQRCIESVRSQSFQGTLRHLIVVDDCPLTISRLGRSCPPNPDLRYSLAKRTREESSGPPRLARLRNYAHTLVDTAWTAYLDDDNEFEADHITSLLECAAATGCSAVHSHRRLFSFEGAPFLEQRWPWCRDPEQGKQQYRALVDKGVMEVGSNIVRDRVDLSPGPSRFVMVDTSEWLINTERLRRMNISDCFSYQDWLDNLAEDDKLMEAILAAGILIGCTQRATLKYYLGGYSNDLSGVYGHSERWVFSNRDSRKTRLPGGSQVETAWLPVEAGDLRKARE